MRGFGPPFALIFSALYFSDHLAKKQDFIFKGSCHLKTPYALKCKSILIIR